MELATAVTAFLCDVTARNLSPKTHQRYQADLADLTQFMQKRSVTTLEQITADALRAYLIDLQNRSNEHRPLEKLSPFTIEGMYRTFKTFFRWCEWEESIVESPMLRVRRIKLPRRIVPRLTEEQVAVLLDEVEQTQSPQRNMALVLLMVDSGLRRGEVLGLTVDDVFLAEQRIHVLGKGRKERNVPLGDASTAALRDWLAIRPVSVFPQVFLNRNGSPSKPEAVRSLFGRLQLRLGLRRLYPHLLRHTFAELYLKRARDVKSLQQILGHSKSSTTLDLYVEHDFDDLQRMHKIGSPVDAIKKESLNSVTL